MFGRKHGECQALEKPAGRRIFENIFRGWPIWGWTGRLLKTREELAALLQSPENEVWLFYSGNELAGFFELVRAGAETEIVYLGLLPEWIGKGLGQTLIRTAVAMAGKNGEKVWLHTCERDHPSALKSYLKAGL
jgi:GNAT superfamily N-acetyltransferase